ncbi:MAG: crossover junction endodeoxyribonuclease RuvC [Bacteriovoracaceae bacterium]
MIILGIDPGSRALGFGVIKLEGRKFKYVDSGVYKFDSIKEYLERLPLIAVAGDELAKKYAPDHVATETIIYTKSVPSLAKLAGARGAILGHLGMKYQGRIFEYAPNLVKSSVSGFGHSSKESVEKAVSLILGLKTFKTHDEADALAIALCHAMNCPKILKNPPKSTSQAL